MNSSLQILLIYLCLSVQLIEPAHGFAPLSQQNAFNRLGSLQVVEVLSGIDASTAVASTSVGATGVAASLNTFFQTQPYLASFLTCSVKASAADIIAQKQEDPDQDAGSVSQATPDVDVSRTLGFLLYGGLYTGIAQNFLFTSVYPRLFGSDESWSVIAEQVLADNFIFGPLLCLPIAYGFKAAFTNEEGLTLDTLKQGLEKYVEDVKERGLLTKYWTLWIPVQFMTFGVIPVHFRVAFVATISFFWIFILSSVAADEGEISKAPKDV